MVHLQNVNHSRQNSQCRSPDFFFFDLSSLHTLSHYKLPAITYDFISPFKTIIFFQQSMLHKQTTVFQIPFYISSPSPYSTLEKKNNQPTKPHTGKTSNHVIQASLLKTGCLGCFQTYRIFPDVLCPLMQFTLGKNLTCL